MIYLGTPYTGSLSQENRRYHAACKIVAEIASHEIPVISPIVHWHHIARMNKLPSNFEFWLAQDNAVIDACSEGLFVKLDGFEHSKGCEREIKHMAFIGKRVTVIELHELGRWCLDWLAVHRPERAA